MNFNICDVNDIYKYKFLGPYGPTNNYRNQQPNMQVPNDLVMKLMEAQQVKHK